MGSQDVCVEAVEAMKHVVDQVRDDQWDTEMPSDFPTADPSTKKTLREVINGIAYDIAWIPDMIAGKTMDEVGRNKFEGDLLGDDPKASFATIAGTSIAAIRDLSDPDRIVHCSYADYPAHNYFVDIKYNQECYAAFDPIILRTVSFSVVRKYSRNATSRFSIVMNNSQ